ncbi:MULTISPECIES: SRPBCC domain-containing protein [unclassified Streptomyces]|uniref:SRPBCC domain-containing protein n=1 Tax=Streptomyces sp. NBC_00119 TaxID=2975659 RepID=A0AAU1UB87_9ACTN|nr:MULTISPECIES: SRPBCC domain-containing protein [unclassified Streptomyces]MCX4644191.1 SRPBCC domain-containing protein [Streptomyces sp. NBC_01446]MCX5325303.1 SRPBCC domain-containing protein [Streptomyces sp. NBC_00120]
MEHEVFVPVPAESLRGALAAPELVARAVPGLQREASGDGGRLKLRIGGHTITYRGSLRVTETETGAFAVEGDGTEARGTGSVKFAVTVRVAAASGGSKVTFVASGSGDGRVAELPDDAVQSAVRRLLTRFAEALGTVAEPGAEDVARTDDTDATDDAGDSTDDSHTSVFETEIPPPSLAPFAKLEPEADAAGEDAGFDADVPPAEAAHARRTMIGRSAEEVDHAPPRGRYAPVPAPESTTATATLRWAAPAAAVVVASAIVVGRVLRRRR